MTKFSWNIRVFSATATFPFYNSTLISKSISLLTRKNTNLLFKFFTLFDNFSCIKFTSVSDCGSQHIFCRL